MNNGAGAAEEEVMLDVELDLGEAASEEEEAAKKAEREAKRQETIRRIKTFLLENKDALILAGQLTLVTIVCVVSIRNDLTPDCCKKKKRRKKR